MRVFEGKKYCLILDNVGLYRLFGLPSDDRDWQAMFEGRVAGKGILSEDAEGMYNIAYSIRNEKERITSDARTELITVMTHEGQRMDLEEAYGYEIVSNKEGLSGVVDKDGKEYELEVLSTLEYNGETYMAVIPADAGEEDAEFSLEVSILKSTEEDGEPLLTAIEDEEELKAVYDLIMEELYAEDDTEEEDQ